MLSKPAMKTTLKSTPTAEWVKPYNPFPLNYHRATRQLFKKLGQRTYYFGKADNWTQAVKKYDHDWPYRERGETPPPVGGSSTSPVTTTERLANLFLAREFRRHERGEISLQSYDDTRPALGSGWTTSAGPVPPSQSVRMSGQSSATG